MMQSVNILQKFKKWLVNYVLVDSEVGRYDGRKTRSRNKQAFLKFQSNA
jgi:hypothetical protein